MHFKVNRQGVMYATPTCYCLLGITDLVVRDQVCDCLLGITDLISKRAKRDLRSKTRKLLRESFLDPFLNPIPYGKCVLKSKTRKSQKSTQFSDTF